MQNCAAAAPFRAVFMCNARIILTIPQTKLIKISLKTYRRFAVYFLSLPQPEKIIGFDAIQTQNQSHQSIQNELLYPNANDFMSILCGDYRFEEEKQ